MDIPQAPREEEMQYTRDVLHGKRKIDLIVIACFAAVGLVFGILIGYAGTVGQGKSLDVGLMLLSAALVAACLAAVAGLMIVTVRSIIAMCKAWVGAKILTGIVCLYLLWRVFGYVQFAIIVPSMALTRGVLGLMGLIFFLLIYNLVLRLIFFVYCKITGKDDDHLIARNIAADAREVDRRMGRQVHSDGVSGGSGAGADAHAEGLQPVYIPGRDASGKH